MDGQNVGGGGLSMAEPGQGQQLKRTYNMSLGKTKNDPSSPQLSKTGAQGAMRRVERVSMVTPNMAWKGALIRDIHLQV